MTAGLLMAATFDDLPRHGEAWGPVAPLDVIDAVLASLREHRLPPCHGFVNGGLLAERPQDIVALQRWRVDGQRFGNHTYSHPSLSQVSAEEFILDIERNEELLERVALGTDYRCFRYPFLAQGETREKRATVRDYLRRKGYRVAEVTVDFLDFLWEPAVRAALAGGFQERLETLRHLYLKTAIERLGLWDSVARAAAGRRIKHVLLLHVGLATALWLGPLLDRLKSEGVAFIGLEEALDDPIYATELEVLTADGPHLMRQFVMTRGLALPPCPPLPREELERLSRPEEGRARPPDEAVARAWRAAAGRHR